MDKKTLLSTHEQISNILSKVISEIKIQQVGGSKEMVLSVNYQKYIYEIQSIMQKEINKAIKIEKQKKSIFRRKNSN